MNDFFNEYKQNDSEDNAEDELEMPESHMAQ